MKKVLVVILSLFMIACSPVTPEKTSEVLENTQPEKVIINVNTTVVTNISYKDVYNMPDIEYMVLFTDDKCEYCVLLNEYVTQYKATSDKTPLYIVDLGDDTNSTAWTEYDLPGIPLLINFSDSLEKYIGLKEISEVLSE